MTQSMFLTNDEIIELTGRQRRKAQLDALNMMMIKHVERIDGTIAVLRSHVHKEFGGVPIAGNIEKPVFINTDGL